MILPDKLLTNLDLLLLLLRSVRMLTCRSGTAHGLCFFAALLLLLLLHSIFQPP